MYEEKDEVLNKNSSNVWDFVIIVILLGALSKEIDKENINSEEI